MVCLLRGGAQIGIGRMLFHQAPEEMESPVPSLSCCSPHGPEVSQPRSPPAHFRSSWHIFPIYRELLEEPAFLTTPISSPLFCSRLEDREGTCVR